MQPDFKTLKPVGEQPDFSTLKPIGMKEPRYFERVLDSFGNLAQQVTGAVQQGAETYQRGVEKGTFGGTLEATGGLLRSALRTTGAVAEGAFTPILEAPLVKPITERAVQKTLEIPGAKELVSTATNLARRYPNASKDIQNIIDIATLGGGGIAEKPLIQEGRAIASDIAQGARVLLTPSEEAVQKNVVSMFNKAIKPTAKKTLGQAEKFDTNIVNALRTIKSNVDNLNIQDSTGEIISGRAPQTIQELSQALDQTKDTVFKQYDSLAKQAGGMGVTIDTKPIAEELIKVAQNPALQLKNPELVRYVEDWAKRLQGFGQLDTETTQEVVKMFNSDLNSFYNNPSYELASKAVIDAGIANNFRKALDTAIEGATGKEYQALKNQYSALKSIESDVVRASIREGRKNTKGLLDYTDMFTNGQMVGGILSLNPAMFTQGAIERGFKEYIKFLNDPNRAIKNIFDKLDTGTSQTFNPTSETGKFIKNPKLGLSIEDVTKNNLLYQEAKKYKSAEEFVKAQGTPLLHGSNNKFDSFDFSKSGSNLSGYATKNKIVSLTDDNGVAKHYGKNIIDAFVDPSKIKEVKNLPLGGGNLDKIIEEARKEGYSAISGYKSIGGSTNMETGSRIVFVFDENALKTKSQLIDIWNKANKK